MLNDGYTFHEYSVAWPYREGDDTKRVQWQKKPESCMLAHMAVVSQNVFHKESHTYVFVVK